LVVSVIDLPASVVAGILSPKASDAEAENLSRPGTPDETGGEGYFSLTPMKNAG